jgi:hypothetical protein
MLTAEREPRVEGWRLAISVLPALSLACSTSARGKETLSPVFETAPEYKYRTIQPVDAGSSFQRALLGRASTAQRSDLVFPVSELFIRIREEMAEVLEQFD